MAEKYKRKSKRIYLMIVLCVLVFTAVTFWGETDVKENEKYVISEQENIEAEPPMVFISEQQDEVKEDLPEIEEEEMVYVFSLSYPVEGEIIQAFSGDKLVYSQTLGDWRVHNGIDIKTRELERVLASERGIVERVYDDELMGKTIIIDHQNGYKTVYSNLSSTEMVNNGEEIEKGDIISGAGKTALAESALEQHIHFQVIKDGVSVNPEEYISGI